MIFRWFILGLVGLFAIALVFAMLRERKLRKSGVLPPTGKATMADVERLIQSDLIIDAIRCYREIHQVGLADAKKAVEELARDLKSRKQP
jgi:ribosomal protein L7/L12